MEQLPGNLYDRSADPQSLISKKTQYRWILQITNAMAWLETLRIAHCDLRPPNILLDPHDSVKLCDFESALEYGQPLLGAHKPYYKWLRWFGVAGARTEQFAVGSCAYYIHLRKDPDPSYDITTAKDFLTGRIIQKCWNMEYFAIEDLRRDVMEAIGSIKCQDNNVMNIADFERRVRECKAYLLLCKPKLESSLSSALETESKRRIGS